MALHRSWSRHLRVRWVLYYTRAAGIHTSCSVLTASARQSSTSTLGIPVRLGSAESISIMLRRNSSLRRKDHMTQNVQAFSPVVCRGVWLLSESPLTVPEKAQWERILVEEHYLQP